MENKKCSDSLTIMTELVLPNDSNLLGNLMGGRLLYWMDIASALAASKHANSQVVTASVDNVSFQQPIKLGSVVTSNEAFYTFVALDENGHPLEVESVVPETEEEIRLFEGAQRRREVRLVLAGKIKAHEAEALKKLFNND